MRNWNRHTLQEGMDVAAALKYCLTVSQNVKLRVII